MIKLCFSDVTKYGFPHIDSDCALGAVLSDDIQQQIVSHPGGNTGN